jgi:methylmalonyl-CoA/ethylmalonyl-CoA epimerase
MLKKIHHVAVVVRDADQALGFYRDALGLPVTADRVIEDQGVRGVLLACGHSEIELIQPVREGTGVARFLETKGEGLHHVCFESDDVAKELADAKARGLRMIDETPRPGLAGMIGFLHPAASTGTLVEFAQPPADAAHQAGGGAGTIADLDHFVVAVKDIDAGTKTWQSNFGLPLERGGENAALGIKQSILPISGAFIEVISPLGESGPVADALTTKGEGPYLLSLSVRDMPASLAALRERGVRAGDPPAGGSVTFISPRGTNGVLIQLVERKGEA